MAKSFVSGDVGQAFLLPPDVRDWLPEGHVAWFVLDVVKALDTSAFHEDYRLGGAGRGAYDPDLMLALLVYCYCLGERSSRRIQRLCEVDVACRVIMANLTPDHATIARFRARHEGAFKAFFVKALELCAAQGLGSVGTVAVDGTKIEADASAAANRTREALQGEIDAIVADAAATDAAEDARLGSGCGDELPPEAANRNGRVQRLRACQEQLDCDEARTASAKAAEAAQRRVERNQARVAELQAKQDEKRERWQRKQQRAAEQGRKPRGTPPSSSHSEIRRAQQRQARAEQDVEKAKADPPRTKQGKRLRRNTTDPDSRQMVSKNQPLQGYNAQAAVSDDGLIMAAEVTNQPADVGMFTPMVALLITHLALLGVGDQLGTVLADAGYDSGDNLTAPGPDRLIALRRPGSKGDRDPVRKRMRERLDGPEGKALYARRACTVEPTFGTIKQALGFRRFSRRGLAAAQAEWQLVATCHNLLKAYRKR